MNTDLVMILHDRQLPVPWLAYKNSIAAVVKLKAPKRGRKNMKIKVGREQSVEGFRFSLSPVIEPIKGSQE